MSNDLATHVGLDVHLTSIAVAVLAPGAKTPMVNEIPNEPRALRRAVERWKTHGELRCCYEAGPCGFEVYRHLKKLGVPCDVIAPALIPKQAADRIKTDRRDATKLAMLHRAGVLTTIRVPTPEEEAVRDLIRAREDVRRDLVAARLRMSGFLLRHGRIYTGGKRKWTRDFWVWLKHLEFEQAAERITFEHYQLQVHHLIERQAALEEEIGKVAETEPYRGAVRRLSCLRGIKVLSAMILLAEIQDFRRFDHPRRLMSFVGLVPSEHSSGGSQRRGRLTKTGNSHARRILIEAAWCYRHRPACGPRCKRSFGDQPPSVIAHAKKAEQRLHKRYMRMVSRGKTTRIAVAAIARELCGFVWALMVEKAA